VPICQHRGDGNAAGKTGQVLGFTWDGTFSLSVIPAAGPTTYEFTSAT
jgi:hypothetical protein